MTAIINPLLRPISDAKPGECVFAYSADTSPIGAFGYEFSFAKAAIGSGPKPGIWIDGYGFFEGYTDLGVTWTHYLPIPQMMVEAAS